VLWAREKENMKSKRWETIHDADGQADRQMDRGKERQISSLALGGSSDPDEATDMPV